MVQIAAFRREIEVYVNRALSVEGQRALFVATAEETLDEFEDAWQARLSTVSFERFVDGVLTEEISRVRIPNGVVAERVVAVAPILDFALEQFDRLTKVVTGGYKSQTHIFLNGSRVSAAQDLVGSNDLLIVANVSDFARKAERQGFNLRDGAGFSTGLFETVAAITARQFADTANAIYFTFRDIEGDRVPVLAIGGAATFSGRRPRRLQTRR